MITRQQYEQLTALIQQANAIVKDKLVTDIENNTLWNRAAEQIALIRKHVNTLDIPSREQKKKIDLGLMLARTFTTPENSRELAPLFQLQEAFIDLGVPTIDPKAAASAYDGIMRRGQ